MTTLFAVLSQWIRHLPVQNETIAQLRLNLLQHKTIIFLLAYGLGNENTKRL